MVANGDRGQRAVTDDDVRDAFWNWARTVDVQEMGEHGPHYTALTAWRACHALYVADLAAARAQHLHEAKALCECAEYWRNRADKAEAERARLDASQAALIERRDALEDQIEAIYYALGGDGEWCAKLPPEEPPNSGDLGADALALATELREAAEAEAARLRTELRYIAEAKPRTQGDDWSSEFIEWAQNRARAALAQDAGQ